MFDQDSRYAKLPLKETTDAHGRPVTFVSRRLIRDDVTPLAQIKVQAGDRIDHLANRAYGDPRQFWRIGDANPDLYRRDPSAKWWRVQQDADGVPIPEDDPLADRISTSLKLNPIEVD